MRFINTLLLIAVAYVSSGCGNTANAPATTLAPKVDTGKKPDSKDAESVETGQKGQQNSGPNSEEISGDSQPEEEDDASVTADENTEAQEQKEKEGKKKTAPKKQEKAKKTTSRALRKAEKAKKAQKAKEALEKQLKEKEAIRAKLSEIERIAERIANLEMALDSIKFNGQPLKDSMTLVTDDQGRALPDVEGTLNLVQVVEAELSNAKKSLDEMDEDDPERENLQKKIQDLLNETLEKSRLAHSLTNARNLMITIESLYVDHMRIRDALPDTPAWRGEIAARKEELENQISELEAGKQTLSSKEQRVKRILEQKINAMDNLL